MPIIFPSKINRLAFLKVTEYVLCEVETEISLLNCSIPSFTFVCRQPLSKGQRGKALETSKKFSFFFRKATKIFLHVQFNKIHKCLLHTITYLSQTSYDQCFIMYCVLKSACCLPWLFHLFLFNHSPPYNTLTQIWVVPFPHLVRKTG